MTVHCQWRQFIYHLSSSPRGKRACSEFEDQVMKPNNLSNGLTLAVHIAIFD